MHAVKWESTNYSLSLTFFLCVCLFLDKNVIFNSCGRTEVLPGKLKICLARTIFLKISKFGKRQPFVKERESQNPSLEDGYNSRLWQFHCACVVWLWYPNYQLILRGDTDPWTWHSHNCASAEWHRFDLQDFINCFPQMSVTIQICTDLLFKTFRKSQFSPQLPLA